MGYAPAVPDGFRLLEYLVVFALAGAGSGFLSGLFGIGGGILRIPIFLSLFPPFGIHGDMEFHVAAATSLALAVPSGILAVQKHVRLGNFELRAFRLWGVGVALGVIAGMGIAPYVSQFVLKLLFLAFLLMSALYFGLIPDRWVLLHKPPEGGSAFALAFGIGAYTAPIGIAGGSFATPVMKACSAPLPMALAFGAGTSLTVSCLGTLTAIWNGWDVGGRPAWSIGYVDSLVFLVMLPGILLTVPGGVVLATRMEKRRLKQVYTLFLLLIVAVMIHHLIPR